MKTLITLGALIGFAAPVWAQDDTDQLRRDHEKSMRELEKRQKAEREALDRKFREQLEKVDKPRADLQKRCDELLREIEKLANEVRKLQSQVGPVKSSARALTERVIEQYNRAIPQLDRVVPSKPYKIVPRKDGDKNHFEYRIQPHDDDDDEERIIVVPGIEEFELELEGAEMIKPPAKKKIVVEKKRDEY